MHRRGIDWAPRVAAALVTVIIGKAHSDLFGNPENTKIGISIFLGSSALFNASTIFFYDKILDGKLSSDLQSMAYYAVVLNVLAWIAYMSHQSPQVANIMISALTYGIFTRLMWISDGDNDVGAGRDLLRRVVDWGKKIHFKEAQI